jgi:secretion/DNA translocation related TadE-like protein
LWVLACSALVLLVGIAVSLRTSAVLARHRAESAADLAALAAAGRIGFAGDVCAAAAPIARANGGVLVRCRPTIAPDGRSGVVDVVVGVAVDLPGTGERTTTASARAGRLAVGR